MKPKTSKNPESVVREIKRKTRRKFNSEEKIRIVLEGLKGEDSIAAICRREGIAPSLVAKALPQAYTTNGAKRFYRQASAG
jgi:transposase